MKLIVLLRDPVERAYSHWKERRTEGKEPLDFAEALAAEEERTAGERERLIADPDLLQRGVRLVHLPGPRPLPGAPGAVAGPVRPRPAAVHGERDALPGRPPTRTREVLDFVGLPPHELPTYEVFNDRTSSPIDPALREELSAYSAPHNAALEERLGMRFNWS